MSTAPPFLDFVTLKRKTEFLTFLVLAMCQLYYVVLVNMEIEDESHKENINRQVDLTFLAAIFLRKQPINISASSGFRIPRLTPLSLASCTNESLDSGL
jgi:hypothetical protein